MVIFCCALVESGARVYIDELALLVHGDLMQAYYTWISKENPANVDFINIMDQRQAREELVTWVHLSARGNQLLARAIGEKVLELTRLKPQDPFTRRGSLVKMR